jgi:MoxR-like ATPase
MSVAEITEDQVQALLQRMDTLRQALAQAIVGQEAVVEQLLIGLLAGGHVLMVRSLGQVLDLPFRRVQFTPDLMPGDILGAEILEEDHGTGHRSFRFQPGPVFTSLLLADELNRTPPKTQAALLEAMQERTVSFAGVTHQLPRPFFVLATQNPLEQAGTYPLPEAQLDRFLLHVRVDYPTEEDERAILAQTTGAPVSDPPRVMGAEEVLALQAMARQVHLSPDLLAWITRLVRATRPGDAGAPADVATYVRFGAGPRAGQSLVLAAKARALLRGRLAATREDIVALAPPVIRHRLLLAFAAEAEGRTADDVIAAVLRATSPPRA